MLARHRRHPDSAGAVVRHDEHVAALERTVLGAFTDRARVDASCAAHPRRRPAPKPTGSAQPAPAEQVVIDFARYAAAATDRQRSATLADRHDDDRHDDRHDDRDDDRDDVVTGPGTARRARRPDYQRLRAHLAYLKLLDAAQALPTVLDQARAEGLTPPRWSGCSESRRPRPAARPGGCGSPAARALDTGPVRLRRPTRRRPSAGR